MERTQDTIDLSTPLQSIDTPLEDQDVIHGRIFWLPSREEVAKSASKEKLSNEDLWKREVMRGHSRGAIDERIYSHPVVIVSRPKSQSRVAHFLLITSFKGKTLDEIYDKPNDFHTSRRSWYLPVGPTPTHPDAQSTKTRKRFPTLSLKNGATLRKNSYVDIRNIYQIDWSLLKEYTNMENPSIDAYGFERESFVRMLAKCKTLTEYEPKEQLYTSKSQSRKSSQDDGTCAAGLPSLDIDLPLSDQYAIPQDDHESDFRGESSGARQIPGPQPKVPPDIGLEPIVMLLNTILVRPVEHLFDICHSGMAKEYQNPLDAPFKQLEIKESINRLYRDTKGLVAVVIASI